MTATSPDHIDRIESLVEGLVTKVDALSEKVDGISTKVQQLDKDVAELRDDIKGWLGWLRLVSGVIIVTVGISFVGLVIPLAVAFWRQSLV